MPVTDEKETKSDPPKLGVTENVDLGSDGETLSNKLTEEETEVLVPEITKCALSTCQRVDPEGTEPQPVASEERSESIVPLGQVEARKSQPVEPTEGGGPPFVTEAVTKPPETVWENILQPVEQAKGNALEHPETAEESLTLVTEMVKKLQTSVENPLTEGNKCSCRFKGSSSDRSSSSFALCRICIPEGMYPTCRLDFDL